MKIRQYTKLVTAVTVVTIVSMFSAMVTDLHQYWQREHGLVLSSGGATGFCCENTEEYFQDGGRT